jgi:hypothetical protein
MSTVAVGVASTGERRSRRPGYGLLLRRVLLAQVCGSACLWLATSAFAWVSLVRVNVSGLSLYSPWIVDGAWSGAATVGWAVLVVALIGSAVRASVQARSGGTLSRGLTLLAVAIGGYAPLVLTASSGPRIVIAALATPALVLVIAFDSTGQPRRPSVGVDLSRRSLAASVLVAAVVLVAPFAVLHPLLSFTNLETPALGSNPNADSAATLGYGLHPGEHVQVVTALKSGDASITVTAVRLVGTGNSLRVERIVTTVNATAEPFARTTALPIRVAAWQALWISATVTLTRCRATPVTLSAVRVSYREFGVSLSQTVPLDQSTTVLACPSR